jgi:ElaB/YqjD/DUF883 family membrane-anchored ribosome-binding protein
MNEPYTPFEPQIGAAPKSDEKSTIGTETPNPSIKFESGKTQTGSATEDVKTAARATADKYRAKAEQSLGDAQKRVQSFQKEIEQEVREKPTKAVFTLLGIGLLLGLFFRRR